MLKKFGVFVTLCVSLCWSESTSASNSAAFIVKARTLPSLIVNMSRNTQRDGIVTVGRNFYETYAHTPYLIVLYAVSDHRLRPQLYSEIKRIMDEREKLADFMMELEKTDSKVRALVKKADGSEFVIVSPKDTVAEDVLRATGYGSGYQLVTPENEAALVEELDIDPSKVWVLQYNKGYLSKKVFISDEVLTHNARARRPLFESVEFD